jgi:general secretion pathway protein F
MRSLIAHAEAANFADLLSILIEQGIPYHRAVMLASEASGDPRLIRAGAEVAAAVERGDLGAVSASAKGIPPLLRWLLIAGHGQGGLADSLRQIAMLYRRRAGHQAEKIKVFLPSLLLITVGATATLFYVLTFFVPLASLLRGLAHQQT